MSPSRARRRQPVPKQRSRAEIATAVAAATAVVVFTVFAIWMLRPGAPFVPGTGGIAHRQPRATWLVAGAILAAVLAVVFIRRNRRFRNNWRAATAVALVLVLVIAVVVGVLWPSGLLRHYVSLTPPPTTPTTVTGASTTAPGASTTVAGSSTTTPGATTAPAGTTTPTTAPTTSSSG
jgi:nitrate reductase gamma subunit